MVFTAENETIRPPRTRSQRAGLVLGPLALIGILLLPTPDSLVRHAVAALHLSGEHTDVQELARGGQATLGLLSIMIVWWLTEAVPIPVTALLPGLLLPVLHVTGARNGGLFSFNAKTAFAAYASPIIYLFLAGFLLAGAMRKSGLDRRVTLGILSRPVVMRGPGTILLVMMGLTAFLSMWISNTATAALMLPIALMILEQLDQTAEQDRSSRTRFGIAMMFGIAWSASIGGLGTIIGSPPNGIVVGILQDQGIARVDFVQWLGIGLPIAVLGVVAAWGVLMIQYRPRLGDTSAGLQSIRDARSRLGPKRSEESATLAVFILVVCLWVSQPFWPILLPEAIHRRLEHFSVTEIGLFCAMLLFIVPTDRKGWRPVLSWRDAHYVDWGTLLLFGGGIALSDAMLKTGLTDWFAASVVSAVGHPGPWVSLSVLVLFVTLLTEVTSNTAVTSMMTPVLIGLAAPLGLPPLTLCIACALAASLAFMLPTATPPNAMVYASGYFRISEMAKAGLVIDLVGFVILVGGLYLISGRLLGLIPL
ncbi:MAG: SLC13 family permease [Phycisphaerae bacterium]